VLSSSSSSRDPPDQSDDDEAPDDRVPTGPLSVIGIGTFAARGISGIASGGTLDEAYAGGWVIAVRRVPSFAPPAAGTTMGTFGPLGRACCCGEVKFGDVIPVSVLTPTFVFGSSLPVVEVASDPGDPRAELAFTLVTDDSSSTGFAAAALVGAVLVVPTSSGIVDAGTHSGIPGRHTSVDGGRTLLASAERSSSVRTSR
jgi:hypothetical protein